MFPPAEMATAQANPLKLQTRGTVPVRATRKSYPGSRRTKLMP